MGRVGGAIEKYSAMDAGIDAGMGLLVPSLYVSDVRCRQSVRNGPCAEHVSVTGLCLLTWCLQSQR